MSSIRRTKRPKARLRLPTSLIEIFLILMIVISLSFFLFSVSFLAKNISFHQLQHLHEPREQSSRIAIKTSPSVKLSSSSFRCEDTGPFNEIVLRSERHMGSNFVNQIIKSNMIQGPRCCKDTAPLGQWKHGFLDGYNFRLNITQVLVVLSRDIFMWLPKLYNDSYCQGRSKNAFQYSTLDKRLGMGMGHLHDRNPRMKHKVRMERSQQNLKEGRRMMNSEIMKRHGRHGRHTQATFPKFLRTPYNCEDAGGFLDHETRNVIALRTSKYKNWMNRENPDYFTHNNIGCTTAYLTYESVVKDQAKTVGEMLKRFDLYNDTTDGFVDVKGYVKWKGELDEVYTEESRESTLKKHYTVDDIKFILSEIDLDFEVNVLNHNYDYVYDYLKKMDK